MKNIFISSVLMLALAGCGGSDSNSDQTSNPGVNGPIQNDPGGNNNGGNDNDGNDNGGNDSGGNDNGGNDNGGNDNDGNDNGGNDNDGNDNGGNDNDGNDNGGNDNGGNDNGGNDNGGNDNGGNDNGGNDNGGNDNGGNDNGGNDNGDNTAPTAVNDQVQTLINTPIDIDVLANDRDSNGDNDRLILNDISNAVNGEARIINNTLVFTPAQNFVGEASVEYSITDGIAQDQARVTITVIDNTNVDNAVFAEPDTVTSLSNRSVTINVLGNDRLEGEGALTLMSVTNAINGDVQIDGQRLIYQPRTGFVGTDSFNYRIGNGLQATAEAEVTVVIEQNAAPVARNDYSNIEINTAIRLLPLENDVDANDDTLTLAEIDNADTLGQVTIQSGNTISYTPPTDFTGLDAFTYVTEDPSGALSEAVYRINIHRPVETIAELDVPLDEANPNLVTHIVNAPNEGEITDVFPAGDMNNDGLNDMVFFFEDVDRFNGQTFNDVSYVLFGKNDETFGDTFSLSDALPEEGGNLANGQIFHSVMLDFDPDNTFFGVHLNDDDKPDLMSHSGSTLFYFSPETASDAIVDLNDKFESHNGSIDAERRFEEDSTVFDINNDGFNDLIVAIDDFAANREDPSIPPAIKVIYGPFTSEGPDLLEIELNGENGFSIEGFTARDGDIDELALHHGDVNGDGIEDLIIGQAVHAIADQGNAESVFVIWGATQFPAVLDINNLAGTDTRSQRGVRLEWGGTQNTDQLGETVQVLDFNGDNIDDLLLSKAFVSLRPISGFAVVYGTNNWENDIDIAELPESGERGVRFFDMLSIPGVTTQSPTIYFDLAVGDVNADGYGDIVLQTSSSRYKVVLGTPNMMPSPFNTSARLQTWPLIDIHVGSAFTSSEMTVVDINNDGFDDVVTTLGRGGRDNDDAYITYGGLHFKFD